MAGWAVTMHRIAIVGVTGSGKTTLGRLIAQRLNIPQVELDALHWEPNWTQAEVSIFQERVSAALGGEDWVVGGNYRKVRDIVWRLADTLIWLDYRLALILWRLLKRTFHRIVIREELWGGNRETLQAQFGRDSLFLYAYQAHTRHRTEYPQDFKRPEYSHLRLVHLHSPRETRAWLAHLPDRTDFQKQ